MIKKSQLSRVAVLLLFLLVLVACGGNGDSQPAASKNVNEPSTDGQETRLIKHELGETNVPLNPKNIVVLEQGFTEVVAALGVKPVGVADDGKPERMDKDTLALIEGYTSVGRRSEPSLELIRTLKPDLIIADLDRHANVYNQLSAISSTIVLKNDTASYEETLDNTTIIGRALGKEAEVKQLIAKHQAMVNDFKSTIGTDRKILIAGVSEEDNLVFEVRSSRAFTPSFFESVGVPYAMRENAENSYTITIEQLLQIDPDILVFFLNEDQTSIVEQLKDNELFKQMKAVKNGSVHEVSLLDWSRRRSILAINDILPKAADILKEK